MDCSLSRPAASVCLAGQVLHCRMPPEAICRGSRCGDFQTDRWRRSLWRGNGRHFSYQDLSLDKAYIIGFSLKDNLKNLPETKERDKYPIQEEEIAHIPILWCHASCLTQGRFQQRQMSWFLCHNYDDRNAHSSEVPPPQPPSCVETLHPRSSRESSRPSVSSKA